MKSEQPGGHDRGRPSWAGLRRLDERFLRPRRAVLAAALLGLLAQAALGVPVPLLQGMAVDRLAARLGPSPAPSSSVGTTVALLVGAMLACHLGRMALGWKVAATMSRVALEVVRELTDTMHRKLQRLSTAYFDREPTGRIMTRLTSDVGSLLIFLNGGSLQLVSDLVLATLISGLLFWLEWRLAVVGLLAMPLFVLNHRAFSGSIHELSHAMREQVASLYALLSERVSAVRVVRSFVGEDAEIAAFDDRIDAQRSVGWTSMRTVARQSAWATLINGLGMVGVLTFGAVLVHQGQMSVGELLAASALLTQLYQPIVRLTGAQAMIAATLVAVDRIVEVLDEPEVPAAGDATRPLRKPEGRLVFREVSFGYPGVGKVLDDINLAIEPGMTLGVLGASGSGKSTLLSLAPRIRELPEWCGTITLDGHDVRRLELSALRRSVALVPQQAVLFEGTIRSNLTYAARSATDAEVQRGARGQRPGRVGGDAAGGPGHPGRRARADALGRAAPAAGAGACARRRPGRPAPRRLHERHSMARPRPASRPRSARRGSAGPRSWSRRRSRPWSTPTGSSSSRPAGSSNRGRTRPSTARAACTRRRAATSRAARCKSKNRPCPARIWVRSPPCAARMRRRARGDRRGFAREDRARVRRSAPRPI